MSGAKRLPGPAGAGPPRQALRRGGRRLPARHDAVRVPAANQAWRKTRRPRGRGVVAHLA